ncbi:MAG: SHOCT domain-containing protein [Motilibacteraceae bacterium]
MHGIPPERDAERLLDERFARGEIDAEEYRTRRDLLRSR